jgi:HAD superfamily hydrolase (TIGR01549 family)
LKYKYILLDIDGTLINFDESFRAASHRILTLDKTPATDDNINAYYKINDDAWYSLDMENMDNPYIISNYHSLYRQYIIDAAVNSKKHLCLNSTPDILAKWYEEQWAACSIPNPEAIKMCQELATNHTLCIATNGLTDIQLNKLTEFRKYITHYFVSEDIGHIKPEKEYFEYILNALNASHNQCLMVGDSLNNDIRGANTLGIASCYYNPLGKINNSGIVPTYEIRDFNELLEIVK